jgi:hypothetical protein
MARSSRALRICVNHTTVTSGLMMLLACIPEYMVPLVYARCRMTARWALKPTNYIRTSALNSQVGKAFTRSTVNSFFRP